jgi:hypothetical protein
MDASAPNTPPPADWTDHFASSLVEQQQRVERFLDAQRAQMAQIEAELDEELRRYEQGLQRRESQLTHRETRTDHQRRRIGRALRARRETLAREAQLHQGELEELQRAQAASGPYNDPASDDLQRRLNMAMEDLRDLRARNAELEKRLTEAQSSRGASPTATGNLSWEVQKQQVLAALNAESDDESPEAVAERVKIDDVIRSADVALRAKEREIEEMRHLLQDQSTNIGGMAVGAAALGQMLDGDALIREERENIQRMKQQWEDMLRQAEVELSVERARVARERAELDEKLRLYEAEQRRHNPPPGTAEPANKSGLSRWRTRLGLGEPQQE